MGSYLMSGLKMRLRSRDFTIISNNCWGAHVYQWSGMEYQTPFIGLFLVPECYLRLLSNLRFYLERPLVFRNRSRHAHLNLLREQRHLHYPIGCLNDEVEIHFLHYETPLEASEKWSRRVKRVHPHDDQLFIKFCDYNWGCRYPWCSDAQIAEFDRLPFRNKVCFVGRPMPEIRSAVWIPESRHDGFVPDGLVLSGLSPKYFDAAGWIKGTNGVLRYGSFRSFLSRV